MTLELNAGLRGKLERLIADVLSSSVVSTAGSIRVMDFWRLADDGNDALSSLKKSVREELEAWLGNVPIFAFVFSKVREEIADIDRALREENAPLTSLPGFEEPATKARQLVEAMTALPHEYVVSFSLPTAMSSQFQTEAYEPVECGPFAIAGSWQQRTSDLFPAVPTIDGEPVGVAPQNALAALARYGTAPAARDQLPSLCVQIRVKGLVLGFADEPVLRAKVELKALVGLAIATELLEARVGLGGSPGPNCQTNVHTLEDSTWIPHEADDPLDGIGDYLKRLQFKEGQHDIPGQLSSLVRLFGTPHIGSRLKLAGRWIFDGYSNGDSVMRFMQFAIAMEVLLQSDAGDNGLTKTLSNRCAYLIAKSAKERDALRDEFGHLYGLRSKIVHNGTDRLMAAEHRMARRFQQICGQVVKAELRLALADVE